MNFFDTRPEGIAVVEGDGMGALGFKVFVRRGDLVGISSAFTGCLNATPIFKQGDAGVWIVSNILMTPHSRTHSVADFTLLYKREGFTLISGEGTLDVYNRVEFRDIELKPERGN